MRTFDSQFMACKRCLTPSNALTATLTRRDLASKGFIKKDPNRVLNVLILSLTDLSCCIYPLDYILTKYFDPRP